MGWPWKRDYARRTGIRTFPKKWACRVNRTRANQPARLQQLLWVMGQYSAFATAEETNSGSGTAGTGTAGFSCARLAKQIGLDSADPQAAGEVGEVGVAIDSPTISSG